ncbi:MAG: leucine-rich repeat domain-containing protein [Prevotella sp.]|nr:leucine-rich repeat domain-containing protein [Prevotella sp.]
MSQNTLLRRLDCYSNQIKGEAMDVLINSLPTVESSNFYVINTKDENEGNVCTKKQVAIAKTKGWAMRDYNGGNDQEYEGSDDVAEKLLLNAENFPDANFRAALASELGISEGDEITAEKIAATTSLDVSKKSIADLTGIEHFTALRYLYCYDNQLTSLDVSGCTALTSLRCEDNQLTSLNVSGCTVLANFYCYNNQLTALDVSKNTALIQFRCDNNLLTSLDVSQNTALTMLYCDNNQLTSIDVSKNTALQYLQCNSNQLTSLDVSGCTALTTLYCYNNQLTSLDVSKNTALTDLWCSNNQLTSLDVSKNTALQYLQCYRNQLTSLDVSGCTALTWLDCGNNQLASLDVSKNTALTTLSCYHNQIKGEAMDALVASLPTVESGNFYVINTLGVTERNVCTKSQVAIAKEKGWTVYGWNGSWDEYEGSDDPEEDIDPVDEGDSVDFGNDMDENTNLNGNVIGNIFYNIGDSDGKYDSAEGCIVVKKPMSDSDVSNLEGKDIFGEDFKNNFTGIVFKVPAGKGVVKVDAETTGNMLLKVKIGNSDPVEMELDGKLKVKFPYNVSEPTLVYIYAGVANEAKGFGAPASGDAALKIYGIEFTGDDTPTGIDNSQFTMDNSDDAWYSLDGKKLNGEPKEKGVYIRNGKKIVK